MAFRLLSLTLLALMAVVLGGCETTSQGNPNANTEQTNTSSIPWNRPQGWEGPGAYGSMMQSSR